MSDDVLPAEQVSDAELWLMPEFSGKRIFTGSVSSSATNGSGPGFNQSRSGQQNSPRELAGFGFSAQASTNNHAVRAKPRLAMTESLVLQLEQEAKEIGFKEGRAAGYEKGYAEGELRATETARQTLAAQQAALSQLMESIVDPLATQRDGLKLALTGLVASIAERVCYRELMTDNTSIETVVSEAVNALPIGEKCIQIFLNVDDLKTLTAIPDFVQSHWQLTADEHLQAGDCHIKSDNSLVDFSLSTRLQAILDNTFSLDDRQ